MEQNAEKKEKGLAGRKQKPSEKIDANEKKNIKKFINHIVLMQSNLICKSRLIISVLILCVLLQEMSINLV